MSGKRILGEKYTHTDISASAPTGTAGVLMSQFHETARPRYWLITVVVTVAPSDVYVWGSIPAGTADDPTDDTWGLFQDEYKTFPLGKIATALPIGTFHFETQGLGLFSQVAFQKSAGTVSVTVAEIYEGGLGN